MIGSDVQAIVIDPVVPSTNYAGASNVGLPGGVVKSNNGGASWTPMNNGLTNLSVTSLTIRPDHTNILYAGTEGGGVFRSDVGGLSWSSINVGLSNLTVEALVVDPAHPDIVYAGTFGDGIWRSTNTGASWLPFNAGSPNPFIHGFAMSPSGDAVHAATSGSVYNITFRGPGTPGL